MTQNAEMTGVDGRSFPESRAVGAWPIVAQLRRRREAADRLPPLECGHRDPLDCHLDNHGPSPELIELAEHIEPGDIVELWAEAKAAFFAKTFPPYASKEWRELHPDDPRRLAGALDAAEKWRKYGDDATQWLEDAFDVGPSIWQRRTMAQLDEAAKPKPAHQLRATPGWPPIAVPGKPGTWLAYEHERAVAA
ncbi:hypothetical protein ACLQ2H_01285 [Streptomyces globisporus]|uniref:hypothetical protein n=1 Tax=Streptomyces globisporus TaxID=1908 RepID=UPI003CF4802A